MSRCFLLWFLPLPMGLEPQVPERATILPQEGGRLYVVGPDTLQKEEATARERAGPRAHSESLLLGYRPHPARRIYGRESGILELGVGASLQF